MISVSATLIHPAISINKINQAPVGKHNHIPDDGFCPKELEMGIKVEFEHTDDFSIAKAIAKDHLAECENYYTRLLQMEKDCEKDQNKKIK